MSKSLAFILLAVATLGSVSWTLIGSSPSSVSTPIAQDETDSPPPGSDRRNNNQTIVG